MQRQQVPQLPLSSDLLVRIFTHIKPEPPAIRYHISARSDETFLPEYVHFHSLRLVCKQFKEAFDEDSHNSNHLLLHHRFSSKSLLGLLDWLQKNKLAVRSFEANCGEPYIELALAALASPESVLRRVCLIRTSKPTLELLSTFPFISSCILALDNAHIDLQPFQNLTCLKELHLQRAGVFSNLHVAHHLTALLITGTEVESEQDCPCVFSLLDLQVRSSKLRGLHSSGLSACTGLHNLTLDRCLIEAEQADDRVDLNYRSEYELSFVPSSITALTQLTHLSVWLDSLDVDLPYDMSWMYALRTLQCLVFGVAQYMHKVPVGNGLCMLGQLTKLELSGSGQTCFSLEVAWFMMRNLQVLSFCDCSLSPGLASHGNPHANLCFAPALSTLSFFNCKPTGSVRDMQNYALWLAMSASRPMQILVDGESFAAQLDTARQTYAIIPEVFATISSYAQAQKVNGCDLI